MLDFRFLTESSSLKFMQTYFYKRLKIYMLRCNNSKLANEYTYHVDIYAMLN